MAKRIVPALVVVAVAALAALLAYSQLRSGPLKVSGIIEADEIRLGSRVGGRVAEVAPGVEEGTRVKKDEPLVTLEPHDLNERRALAAADLLQRQSELAKLKAVYPIEKDQAQAIVDRLAAQLAKFEKGPRDEEITAAEAKLALSEAQLERAQLNYDRTAALYATEKGATSRERVDRATEELEVARETKRVRQQELQLLNKGTRPEEIDEAQAALREAQHGLSLIDNRGREEIKRAEAAIASADAAMRIIDAQLRELVIRAPADGVIEATELEVGDLVGAGAPVMSMVDMENLWVRAYVPENELHIKLNQQVKVTVDSYPDKVFKGSISFIARQGEFTPSNVQTPEERSKQVFRIKVTLQSGQDELRPGMAADIWLE